MILLSGIYAAKIHLLYIQTDKSIVVTPAVFNRNRVSLNVVL